MRGATILITLSLGAFTPVMGLRMEGVLVGIIFLGVAFASTFFIEETYNKELDYFE